MEVITSLQNKTIKMVMSLKLKKYRDESSQFMVEGVRLVEEAVNSNWDVKLCLYTPGLQQERVQTIISACEGRNIRLLEVPEGIFKKISDTEEPQGILAVLAKQEYSINQVVNNTDRPMLVVLDEIQDPGNAGTVIRTAAAAGCTAVLLTKGCADIFSPKTVRASMGSLFTIPVCQGLAKQDVIAFMEKNRIAMFATSLASSRSYFTINYNKSVAFVFGNEGNGVSKEILDRAEERIHIPLLGNVESLNVSASAAVILYEAVRQRS